jgi:pyruvate/2-oxoglutarate dehydrogenase complex dihydrolipoamide dehydrogenase (E3) component
MPGTLLSGPGVRIHGPIVRLRRQTCNHAPSGNEAGLSWRSSNAAPMMGTMTAIDPHPDPVTVDVVVLGAGPAGEVAAERLSRAGLEVMIVEEALVGGECAYAACIPSKALLRAPAALEAATRVEVARESVSGPVDAAATLRRRTRFTHGWRDESQVRWLETANVELRRGHARLVAERQIEVSGGDGDREVFLARHAVVVATGSSPQVPPIPGLADAAPWTNREATRASAVPRRLIILGGGPVGCELAVAWRALGTESVMIVERGPRLLSRVEAFAGNAVRRGLEDRGIDVRTDTAAVEVERTPSCYIVRVAPSTNNGAGPIAEVSTDELVVALGRTPNTSEIGLERVGLGPGAWLPTGDDGLVDAIDGDWLYAVGDVTGHALLTHMGKYQARTAAAAIVARARGELASTPAAWSPCTATAQHLAVTQVIFTSPEVAAVGLTEEEARRRYSSVRTVEHDLAAVAGSTVHADDYAGSGKLVIDADREVVVGATLVGPDVGELFHAATIAVVGEVPISRLHHAVPAFPTISEVWLGLLDRVG